MVSRENAVILPFVVGSVALAHAAGALTSLSDGVLVGVLIFVGVVAPQLINGYLDGTDPA